MISGFCGRYASCMPSRTIPISSTASNCATGVPSRQSVCSVSTATLPTSSSRTESGSTSTPGTADGASQVGAGARRPRDRSLTAQQPARLGRQAPDLGGLPFARRSRRGQTRGSSWSTCSTPTCDPTRACTAVWPPTGGWSAFSTDDEISRAAHAPPEDTRAWFRGECVRRYGAQVTAASWDSVIFDIPGRASLQRVPMLEPLRGTRAHVGDLLERCQTAVELVDALTST